MSALKRKLDLGQIEQLITHIVDNGESYRKYLDWCAINDIPDDNRFTENYYKRWCQRRRSILQERRARRQEELRRGSMLTRERRLMLLEDSLKDLQEQLGTTLDPSERIRTHEQVRKTLEQIAKERGEWDPKNKIEEKDEDKLGDDVQKGFLQYFEDQKRLAEAREVN